MVQLKEPTVESRHEERIVPPDSFRWAEAHFGLLDSRDHLLLVVALQLDDEALSLVERTVGVGQRDTEELLHGVTAHRDDVRPVRVVGSKQDDGRRERDDGRKTGAKLEVVREDRGRLARLAPGEVIWRQNGRLNLREGIISTCGHDTLPTLTIG